MNNHKITANIVCREILRLCGGGRLGVQAEPDGESVRFTVCGVDGGTEIFTVPNADLLLSLDDFEDKHLKRFRRTAYLPQHISEWITSGKLGVERVAIEIIPRDGWAALTNPKK